MFWYATAFELLKKFENKRNVWNGYEARVVNVLYYIYRIKIEQSMFTLLVMYALNTMLLSYLPAFSYHKLNIEHIIILDHQLIEMYFLKKIGIYLIIYLATVQ